MRVAHCLAISSAVPELVLVSDPVFDPGSLICQPPRFCVKSSPQAWLCVHSTAACGTVALHPVMSSVLAKGKHGGT